MPSFVEAKERLDLAAVALDRSQPPEERINAVRTLIRNNPELLLTAAQNDPELARLIELAEGMR